LTRSNGLGAARRPQRLAVKTSSLEALIVLFCCHLAKQAVDTARVGAGMAGTSVVLGG
jgi:hypothetical protein